MTERKYSRLNEMLQREPHSENRVDSVHYKKFLQNVQLNGTSDQPLGFQCATNCYNSIQVSRNKVRILDKSSSEVFLADFIVSSIKFVD